MTDLDAAWWAKLRRASTHRGTLRGLADEFQASEPYTLNPEPGERPNEVAYRLRIRREAPAEISTVVGDVLHNLRSALDSLAYELAVQSKGAALTRRESEVTYFPCFPSFRAYEGFFGLGDEPTEASRLRGRIYGPEARKAMQAAQPFWWTEFGHEHVNFRTPAALRGGLQVVGRADSPVRRAHRARVGSRRRRSGLGPHPTASSSPAAAACPLMSSRSTGPPATSTRSRSRSAAAPVASCSSTRSSRRRRGAIRGANCSCLGWLYTSKGANSVTGVPSQGQSQRGKGFS